MKPTLGRIVRFVAWSPVGEHQAAMITKVWSDTCVNVTVFPPVGFPYVASSVTFNADGTSANTWHWPPREPVGTVTVVQGNTISALVSPAPGENR
jgi:hypothetical protein